MSGLAVALDFLRKSPTYSTHSHGVFSATATASAAAFSVAASAPFSSRFLFSSRIPVAYCDAGTALPEDEISNIHEAFGVHKVVPFDSVTTKEYRIELRPLFSAFGFRALAMTSIRSFLMFYLPLLEPRSISEEDEDDFHDPVEETQVDLVVPFKKSVKQIARETSVVTTRRMLERLTVMYVSQRMAWKLLKDIPMSAIRKSRRGMPTVVYIWRVSRTTFRGQFLACAASWVVQVGIETYRCVDDIFRSNSGGIDTKERVGILGKRVFGSSVKCGASLVFASLGAGIGASLLRPSLGQWIGCIAGDFAGPVIVAVCFNKFLHASI